MSGPTVKDIEISRVLLDLKLCTEVIGKIAGCLDSEEIAKQVTEGLVATFGCAFARIWLVMPDRKALKLISSSGLYTRTDGSFAQVPMGSFKIGKIAQHCIPFLSNCLPEESWVKDKEWAIANGIQGFAGLPLIADDQTIGVLAIFSTTPMDHVLLEVLQVLSLSVSGALASALKHQALLAKSNSISPKKNVPLSEQLAAILGQQKLSMLGNEQLLPAPVCQLLIQLAKRLANFSYRYCRLLYEQDFVILETVISAKDEPQKLPSIQSFEDIAALATTAGGSLVIQSDTPQTIISVRLRVPQVIETENVEQTEEVAGSPLSEREQEVIQLMAQGLRDRDIADQLFISTRTVKFHAKNILTKLEVNTRMQAIFEATKKGWLRYDLTNQSQPD